MTQSAPELLNRGRLAERALAYREQPELRSALASVPPAAMQTLLGAVQRAASLAEIEIVIRYQQARAQKDWSLKLVEQIWKDLKTSADSVSGDREKARAATDQLSLIARVHRVVRGDGEANQRREEDE